MSVPNLMHFVDIVRRDHPEWPRKAVRWQAEKMRERHPVLQKAVDAGLANGRDLRERMEHGLGVWWPEMEPLSPAERGFVLALVRAKVGIKPKAQHATLEAVRAAQAEEAYEAEADDLAADWRERSDKPDSRVKVVSNLSDLAKPKARA